MGSWARNRLGTLHRWHQSPARSCRWSSWCVVAFLGIHGVTDDLRIGHSSGFAVCKPTDQMSSCTSMWRPSENFSVCNLNNLTDDVACTTKKKDVVAVIRLKITFEKK